MSLQCESHRANPAATHLRQSRATPSASGARKSKRAQISMDGHKHGHVLPTYIIGTLLPAGARYFAKRWRRGGPVARWRGGAVAPSLPSLGKVSLLLNGVEYGKKLLARAALGLPNECVFGCTLRQTRLTSLGHFTGFPVP